MTKAPSIALDEFAGRRKKLRTSLKKSIGLVFAGQADSQWDAPFRPHPHFEYLAGVTDEPGAVLMLDPANPIEARREMLFLRPLNPEIERWDGYRPTVGSALRTRTGFKAVFRLDSLPRFLNLAATRAKSLACLHPLAYHDQPVSPDLALFKKVAERIPGITIDDHSIAIPKMRAAKSRAEVAMIQQAVDITAVGFKAAMNAVKPGMNEFEVQETIEHAYKSCGARETSFHTIAGAGVNTTVLHYRANDQPLEDGDLILIDSGAKFGGYSADITRTIPVNGTFTKRQREVYDIVLKAQDAAIKACKPGATLSSIDQAARKVITNAGFGDAFIHGIGHHLGMETHDADPNEPLRAGAVVTIEPGIYLPDEKIGVRIEDDILITSKGHRNLSKDIPKRAADIEKLMASHKPL